MRNATYIKLKLGVFDISKGQLNSFTKLNVIYSLLNFISVSLGSIIELAEKQQYVKEASKDDNEEVELSKNEVAMETVEINWSRN